MERPAALMTDDFEARLQAFVGLETGPPAPGPDEVNQAMIRHMVEALGDTNPVYVDEAAAAASVHRGIVAPPTMLQSWVMHGFNGPKREGDGPYERMNALLFSRGFTSVVATNCEQTYARYLRPGDRVTMRSTIDAISPEKTTALGTGHFVTTRQEYFDADDRPVASMLFRIFRFRPPARKPAKPDRPLPATTPDNQWWFDALNEGRLLIQRCTTCARRRHPTGPMCPHCQSLGWDVLEASGEGTIYSHITVHHPQVPSFDYPLPVVLVELAEGVRMVMNAEPAEDVEIGAPVHIEIRRFDSQSSLPIAVIGR